MNLETSSDVPTLSEGLEAAAELLSRLTAHRSIDELARRLLELAPARHHRFVNRLLEKVEAGEIKRLMLFEPPGHAKSTYASVLFPGFYIGRNPEKQLIAASHTADLAASFGRRVRNLFGAEEWPFDAQLAGDSQAADQWSTSKAGGYYAVGVGGAVHGRRADGIIIDDPMKGRADASSKIKRGA